MRVTEIAPALYHVKFPTQLQLASTFLRFQEHFESPAFKGKVFSLKEFKRWYKRSKRTSTFSYYTDWEGFNIPSTILKPFYEGKFDPLSANEQKLLKKFKNKKGKFYIIGTYKGIDPAILRHEIAHGLFYTNRKYRNKVLKILGNVDRLTKSRIKKALLKTQGYHNDVILDETHTYVMTELDHLEQVGIDIDKVLPAHTLLNQLFESTIAEV